MDLHETSVKLSAITTLLKWTVCFTYPFGVEALAVPALFELFMQVRLMRVPNTCLNRACVSPSALGSARKALAAVAPREASTQAELLRYHVPQVEILTRIRR